MRSQAAAAFQQVVQEEMRKEVDDFPQTQYNAATVDAARVAFETKVTAINSATTHDDLVKIQWVAKMFYSPEYYD
jgi:hypothetical protein